MLRRKRGKYKPRKFAPDSYIREPSTAVRLMCNVDAYERLVLYCLASHVNRHGLAWPSRETIAHETSLTVRGLIRILKRLEQKRLIVRVAQGGGKPGSCAQYEWPQFPSIKVKADATDSALETLAALADPPRPGSYEDYLDKMPSPKAG